MRTATAALAARVDVVIVSFLLILALASRLTMAVTVPVWQGPDEPKLFQQVRLLVDLRNVLWSERRLLVQSDASPRLEQQVIASMVAHHYWHYHPLPRPTVLPNSFIGLWGNQASELGQRTLVYDLIAAATLLPFRGSDLETQLLVVRCVSVVLSALTVPVTYVVARTLAPDDRFVAAVSAAFVATLPMHVFMGGMLNNDNGVSLAGALVVLGITRCLGLGFTARRWAFVFLALMVALMTKRTAVGLLPGALLVASFGIASLPRRRTLLLGAVIGGLAVALGATLAADPGARPIEESLAHAYAPQGIWIVTSLLTLPWASPLVPTLIVRHLTFLFRSFWGILGWFDVPLPESLYRLLEIVTFACAIGWVAELFLTLRHGLASATPRATGTGRILLVFLVLTVVSIVLAVLERLAFLDPGQVPQGRYLFVAVTPIAVGLAVGARFLLPRRWVGTVGPRARVRRRADHP